MYAIRGFRVSFLVIYVEFECIGKQIKPINLETVAADNLVGDIEVSVTRVKQDTTQN